VLKEVSTQRCWRAEALGAPDEPPQAARVRAAIAIATAVAVLATATVDRRIRLAVCTV